MKNSLIIIILVIIVAVGGGMYFLSQKSSSQNDAMMKEETSTATESKGMTQEGTNDAMMKKDNDDKMMSDHYVTYSKVVFDNAANKKRVLFFYANWCPICIPADKNFTENVNNIPEDVVLIRVNYNDTDTDEEEKELATKYAVTYQHTFVQIDASGNAVTKWNGGKIDELLANVK